MPLFDSHIFSSATNANDVFQYDVTADGKRFLAISEHGRRVFSPSHRGDELAGRVKAVTWGQPAFLR